MEAFQAHYEWKFRTKHEPALKLVRKALGVLQSLGSRARVVATFDGAYAAMTLVRPLLSEGATVGTRLRGDAKLFDVPPERKKGQPGRPRKYDKKQLSSKSVLAVTAVGKRSSTSVAGNWPKVVTRRSSPRIKFLADRSG